MNSLPKLVSNVRQTTFLNLLVNNIHEHFAKFREPCSLNTLFDFLVHIVREKFAKVREQCSPNPFFAILVIMMVNNLPVREHDKKEYICFQKVKSDKFKIGPPTSYTTTLYWRLK